MQVWSKTWLLFETTNINIAKDKVATECSSKGDNRKQLE
jgi:hypothetical protein